MSNRSVVVTGLGATTPVGGDVTTTWSSLLAGRSGVRRLPDELADELPVRIGAPAQVEPAEVLSRVEARRLDRCGQLALIAAREAWTDAAGRSTTGTPATGTATTDDGPAVEAERLGVVVATGIGGITTLLHNYDTLRDKGARRVSPLSIPMLMPNGPAAAIGLELGARAGVHAPVSACASGAEAIAYGLEMIRSGRADVVVCGGTEACIHPLPIAAFAAMKAMSMRNDEPERASRPYDKARDGFVLGEGAGILVLESAEHAAARDARVYCELAGAGMSSDAHHIAQPEPSGSGVIRALQAAMRDAGVEPAAVGHVNAHATSTPQGDIAEVLALSAVLGAGAANVPVTAPKSMTGHVLGAAGAIEAVATVKTVTERLVPPTVNLDDPDDEVDMDIVAHEPRSLADGPLVALNNSFGFGGHNVCLVFTGS